MSTWTGLRFGELETIRALCAARSAVLPYVGYAPGAPASTRRNNSAFDLHCFQIETMAQTPSGGVNASTVAHLIDGIVSTERQCARDHAARVAVRRTTSPEDRADERQFFCHAAEMLSATLEVEKWSPLVTALQDYEVREPGKQRELEIVWIPVFDAVKVYKAARFRALGGRRLAQLADGRATQAQAVSGSAPRCSSDAEAATSRTDHGAGRSSADLCLVRASATLLLPPVTPLSGDVPMVQDLLTSIQAGSLGVYRPCAHHAAPSAAAVVNAEAAREQARASGGSGNSSEYEAVAQPVYDRDLLELTARILQQAVDHLEVFSIDRIRSWPTDRVVSETDSECSVRLGTVKKAAAVSCALQHSATEIKKQLVAVDAPHEDLFIGLENHLSGSASAHYFADAGGDEVDKSAS